MDVRVMDGVFGKMPLFADVVHGVPNGNNIKKDAQWIEKSLWEE